MFVDSRRKGNNGAPLPDFLLLLYFFDFSLFAAETGLTGRPPRWSSTISTAEAFRFAWRSCSLANWRLFSSVADHPHFNQSPSSSAHSAQATIKACSQESSATEISWKWCIIPVPASWESSCRSTTWAVSPGPSSPSQAIDSGHGGRCGSPWDGLS